MSTTEQEQAEPGPPPPADGTPRPAPTEARRGRTHRGRRRGRRRHGSGLLLLAFLLLAAGGLRWLWSRPVPLTAEQGYAYGRIVRLDRGSSLAEVRLDGGPVVPAQLDVGGQPGSVARLVAHHRVGDRVQVVYQRNPDGTLTYSVADWQRGPVIPAVLRGADPVVAALAGSGGILVLAMYFVHGLNWKTTSALAGTLATLAVALTLGRHFLQLAHITDFGTEESIYIAIGAAKVDIQGLVLTGVVIGALGALVDITVGQASAVAELARLGGEGLGVREIYRRGMNVGLDHIGSLINTLTLAYVGSALPLLVLLESQRLGWRQYLNMELVGVQLVQTLVGAIALALSVPLTTLISALLLRGGRIPAEAGGDHGHLHLH
jgi:hypothetical protein